MKVVAFASYPIEAAATRYRLHQFVRPLAERGIDLQVKPFLSSEQFASLYDRKSLAKAAFGLLKAGLGRFKDVSIARHADVVLIQREAMIIGPPIIEWLSSQLGGPPMVLDLDDATYVPYTSPTYGKLGKALKWFGKTDDLIAWSTIVTSGNRAIAEYVETKGKESRIIPTVVDLELFRPAPVKAKEEIVLGWVGTHSTFPYLESLFPVLQELARSHRFRLKIVGAGKKEIAVPGVKIENLEWQLRREIQDFQSFDVGLYPIVADMYADQWAAGKSGFKAIQYMAVGIPYVATPIGAINEIGERDHTHFLASTSEEWTRALMNLLSDRELRERMGAAGREHALRCFGLSTMADKLAAALREAKVKGSSR